MKTNTFLMFFPFRYICFSKKDLSVVLHYDGFLNLIVEYGIPAIFITLYP